MSRSRGPVEPRALPYTLFRRAAVPALAVTAVCALVGAIASGWSGFAGAAVGAVIVAVFYLSDLAMLRLAERLPGQALMPIMLVWYLIKIAFLAILMADLWDTSAFSTRAMAITVVVAAIAWTIGLAVSAARTPTFVVDLPPRAQPPSSTSSLTRDS